MGRMQAPAVHALVEPAIAPEFWVSGLAKVERLEQGVYRLYFYRDKHPVAEPTAPMEWEVVVTGVTTMIGIQSMILGLQTLVAEEGADIRSGNGKH